MSRACAGMIRPVAWCVPGRQGIVARPEHLLCRAKQQLAGQQVAPFVEPGAQGGFKQAHGTHGYARLLAKGFKLFFQRAVAIHVFLRRQHEAAQAGMAQAMAQGGPHGGIQHLGHAGGGKFGIGSGRAAYGSVGLCDGGGRKDKSVYAAFVAG